MKPITRDDLLQHIPTKSPYEAVIVAAREARRLNRQRIARASLFPPTAGPSEAPPVAPVMEGVEGESIVAEEMSAAAVEPVVTLEVKAPAVVGPPPGRAPHAAGGEDLKVTSVALERLARGEVVYSIGEGVVEPEGD